MTPLYVGRIAGSLELLTKTDFGSADAEYYHRLALTSPSISATLAQEVNAA